MPAAHPSAGADGLARYRALVADWSGFRAAACVPLAPCLRANTLRVALDALAGLLAEDGITSAPLGWEPAALRLAAGDSPARHRSYRLGLFRVQEEASMLPARVLGPRSGDRVLDLCAAPGNKTAQIAIALGNRGTVVANDVSRVRVAAVQDVVRRFGLVNVTTTTADGAVFPETAGPFDRVLVDAPCSAEGIMHRQDWRASTPEFRSWVAGVQRALLRRAVRLCRPGGRIVYSTCTYAPEENEAIVDTVLREHAGALRVVEPGVPTPAASPGLVRFGELRFHDDLARTLRLWPHESGTGGFYVAALERVAGATPAPRHRAAARVGSDPVLDAQSERYGLPARALSGLHTFEAGRNLRVAADDHVAPADVAIVSTGLALARDAGRYPKLSTAAAMAFAAGATRNVVDLDRARLDAYHRREPVEVPASSLGACHGTGHVVVRHRGFAAGVAVLRPRPGGARLESLYPKAWIT